MTDTIDIEVEKKEEKKEEKVVAKPIEVDNFGGGLVPKTHVELKVVLTQIALGDGFPERFKNPEQRMAAYNLANSLMGSQWQLALNNIAIIKGQMSIYGELPGALAQRTGEVAEKEVYLIDAEYKRICTDNKNLNAEPWAGICQIQRKGRVKKEYSYTMDDAKKAGQYPPMKGVWENRQKVGEIPNEDSPWWKFTKVMLMRKAMNLAIKMEFPEAMVGVPIAEYDFDEAPDLKDVVDSRPSFTERAKALNGRFSNEVQQ